MTKDIALGLIALVFSGFYISEASRIPKSALGDTVGAGGIPIILGWIMAGTAVLLIVHQLWLRRKGRLVPAVVTEAFETPGRAVVIAGGVLVMGAAYIGLLRPLGYIPATALLLAAMLIYQRVPLNIRIALVSLGGAIVLWLLFDAFLGIDLPAGPLTGLL